MTKFQSVPGFRANEGTAEAWTGRTATDNTASTVRTARASIRREKGPSLTAYAVTAIICAASIGGVLGMIAGAF